jgi:hypothetical protein
MPARAAASEKFIFQRPTASRASQRLFNRSVTKLETRNSKTAAINHATELVAAVTIVPRNMKRRKKQFLMNYLLAESALPFNQDSKR